MAKIRCSVSGCNREHHAKGFCNRHYKKYKKYSDPLGGTFVDNRPEYVRKSQKGRTTKKQDTTKRKAPAAAAVAMTPQTSEPDWIPEPKRERAAAGSQANLSFFLNQRFIDKLYSEIVKALKEPLFMSANMKHIDTMLQLSAELAGYDCKNPVVWDEFKDELRTWASYKDKIRFMEALGNWEQRVIEYMPKKAIQLSFDNLTPMNKASRA